MLKTLRGRFVVIAALIAISLGYLYSNAQRYDGNPLKLGLDLGVDYSHTWSCYRGKTVPCGTCPTCVERAAAFKEVGVPDPWKDEMPD